MENIKADEFPCVEYLTAQPESIEQIFYMDNSTVYMHEGQYYIATDSQMMLLDNQELAADSTEMVQEEIKYVPDEVINSQIICTMDEGINQQDEVYELNIVEEDQEVDDLNQANEEEENEQDDSELANLVMGKNVVVEKAGALHKLHESVPKSKKECKPENGSMRLSTYLSGKMMYGRILDVRKVEEPELSDEYDESISRTLVGLMQMESLRKNFEGNPLIIKVNELKDSKHIYKGKVHGFMRNDQNEGWCFVNFNDTFEADVINEAKIKFRYIKHVCATITLTRFMGNLKATKVFQSLELKQYVCIVCYKEFGTTKGLQHHYFTHLETDPDLLQPSEIVICSCEVCNKLTRNHALRIHKCNVCEQGYKDAWTLKRHSLTHTGVKPHTCHLCSRSFALVGDLNTHRKTHYGTKVHVYVCGVCRRPFSRQGNLLRHASIHNNGEHKCHICGSSYQYASSLTRHIMQTHVSTNT